jgi:hypothetical protein
MLLCALEPTSIPGNWYQSPVCPVIVVKVLEESGELTKKNGAK